MDPARLGWVMTLVSVYAVWTVRRRTKSAAHAYPIALPVRGDAARAHERRSAPVSCQTKRPSNNQGRRSCASQSCPTTASFLGRATARSGSGTCRPAPAARRSITQAMCGAGVQSTQRVDRSSTPRRAQVQCVAVLQNGRVVSGSRDDTLKVWDVSSSECLRTLTGHYDVVRRRRPVDNTRRRRDGRRSCVSPPCRTATSCPGRPTARSWCGTSRPASAARYGAGTRSP